MSIAHKQGFIWLLTRLLLITMFTSHGSADDKKYAYDSESVMSSSGIGQQGKACFRFFSFMTAGHFFPGLEYIRTHSAADPADEFRKDGGIISAFPEDLQINVFFHTCPCTGNSTQPLSPAELDDLLHSLQLDTSWKTGVELRPAELIAQPRLTGMPIPTRFLKNSSTWDYVFHVRAKNVPLTDHLVIFVFGPNKTLLGRMTFDLRAALTPPLKPIK